MLFTIRESDAKGSKEFLDWIKVFNGRVQDIAIKYKADTTSWQDFKEANKEKNNESV